MGPLSLVGIGPGRPQASCQFPSAETLILNQATCSRKWRQGEVPGLLSLRAGGCVLICAWYQTTPGPSKQLLLMLRGSVESRASLLPQPEVAGEKLTRRKTSAVFPTCPCLEKPV